MISSLKKHIEKKTEIRSQEPAFSPLTPTLSPKGRERTCNM
jgi:hypothetical protein